MLYASTVDRDWTDWPIRTSFLPALQQIVEYLAGGLDEHPPAPSTWATSGALEVRAGAEIRSVTGPDGRPARIERQRGACGCDAGPLHGEHGEAGRRARRAGAVFAAVLDPARRTRCASTRRSWSGTSGASRGRASPTAPRARCPERHPAVELAARVALGALVWRACSCGGGRRRGRSVGTALASGQPTEIPKGFVRARSGRGRVRHRFREQTALLRQPQRRHAVQAAQSSGATVQLPPGSGYTVSFDSVPNWTAPASQTVIVARAQTTIVNANYSPPVGQPVIEAVHPSFGGISGGTLLTIEGENFTAPATIYVGGKLASNIVVGSSTQISCLTPSNSVYGTAPIVVQTASGSATNANGFSYGTERGNGIELVSAYGGEDSCAAVQGNYAYVGEGSSFVVVDISNPTSPSPIGRIPIPSSVRDVAVSGQYAFLADNDAGLQVVDVTTPAVPKLVGYYYTPEVATGVAVSGAHAIAVDGAGDFLVFDISTPKSPVLLGSTNVGSFVWDVAINGNFAYLLANQNLVIVDITSPNSPLMRGQVAVPYYAESLAVSGNRVFVAGGLSGLRIIDVSNPDAPNDIGSAPGVGLPYAVATSGNLVYTTSGAKFAVSSYSGGTMTFLGANNSITVGGYKLAASGSRAYVPAGASGFVIVDASNPSSPNLAGTMSASSGDYGSVSLSSNYLYACAAPGVKIFNVTNPGVPIQIGQYSGVGGSSGHIIVSNGVAYINGYYGETRILNVANPFTPVLLSTIPSTTVNAVKTALMGNNLFIAGADYNDNSIGHLLIFDVSNPASPSQRGLFSFTATNQGAVSVAVLGNLAVVGLNSGELKVLDISNITSPSVSGGLSGFGQPYDIAMSADGRYAFVSDLSGYLRVVDLSTPSNPVLIASVTSPFSTLSPPSSLALQGSLLYIAGTFGVFCYDISTPSSPALVRSYPGPETSERVYYGIAVATDSIQNEDTIYVGDSSAGLMVPKNKGLAGT